MDLFFDIRNGAAEKIACEGHQAHPADSAEDIIGKKFSVTHLPDAGNSRRERPHNRHKTRNDDRLGPVFFIKFLGADQMVAVKEEGLFTVENLRAEMIADPIAGGVSCDGRGGKNQIEEPDIERSFHRGKKPGRHQKRIARQKKSREQTRLGKDNQYQNEITAPADQLVEAVKIREKMLQDFHSALW